MTSYAIVGNSGTTIVQADSVAEALRSFTRDNPGSPVLSIAPETLARAAEQQA